MGVGVGHLGFFVADVSVSGTSAYFSRPQDGRDALRGAVAIYEALDRYNAELAERPADSLIGRPAILTTRLQSGGAIAVPGAASLSVIRSLTAGEDLNDARDEFEAVVGAAVEGHGVDVSIDFTAPRDHPVGGTPYVLAGHDDLVNTVQSVVRSHLPERGDLVAMMGWSEAPFFTAGLGLPVLYLGPGAAADCHTPREHVQLEEYLATVQAYVDLIAEFCGLRLATGG
jgi:acetylornithine deacetylase/succinyl-diaminopimelate desuccinylase-like protein